MDSYTNNLCSSDNAILLVIDFQPKVFNLTVNFKSVKALAIKLLKLADLFKVPTVICEQYPKGLGPTDPDIMAVYDAMSSDKMIFPKLAFGCCGEEGFLSLLQEKASIVRQKRQGLPDSAPVDLIIMGIEAHVCVLQTVLGLLEADSYRPVLADDCITGRSMRQHHLAISRLQAAGAVVSNFESIAFEWTRRKDDERFKRVNGLLKE